MGSALRGQALLTFAGLTTAGLPVPVHPHSMRVHISLDEFTKTSFDRLPFSGFAVTLWPAPFGLPQKAGTRSGGKNRI